METTVAVFSGGRGEGAHDVRQTLAWGGFLVEAAGTGVDRIDAGRTTTVYVVPGEEERAGWVAAALGAPTRPLPADVDLPGGTQVVVATGADAAGGDGPR